MRHGIRVVLRNEALEHQPLLWNSVASKSIGMELHTSLNAVVLPSVHLTRTPTTYRPTNQPTLSLTYSRHTLHTSPHPDNYFNLLPFPPPTTITNNTTYDGS